jgi:hypothetical protein
MITKRMPKCKKKVVVGYLFVQLQNQCIEPMSQLEKADILCLDVSLIADSSVGVNYGYNANNKISNAKH